MRRQNHFPAIVLLYMLLLIPCFGILGIKELIGESAVQVIMVISMVFLLGRLLYKSKNVLISEFTVLYLCHQLVVFFSTTLHRGFSPGIAVSIIISILLVFLIQVDHRAILWATSNLLVVISIINLIMMIFHPKGENVFFIGGKNQLSMVLIPAVFFLMIHHLERFGRIKWRAYLFAIVCLVSVFLGKSATGIVVAIAMVGAVFLVNYTKLNKMAVFIALLVINALLVFTVDWLYNSEYWTALTELLGKSQTLTSRTKIWKSVMTALQDAPLFGLGRGTRVVFANSYGGRTIVYEAHNFFLELVLEGGLVAFALYMAGLIRVIVKLQLRDPKHNVAFLALCVMLVNGITESTNNSIFVIMLTAVAARYAREENKK